MIYTLCQGSLAAPKKRLPTSSRSSVLSFMSVWLILCNTSCVLDKVHDCVMARLNRFLLVHYRLRIYAHHQTRLTDTWFPVFRRRRVYVRGRGVCIAGCSVWYVYACCRCLRVAVHIQQSLPDLIRTPKSSCCEIA